METCETRLLFVICINTKQKFLNLLLQRITKVFTNYFSISLIQVTSGLDLMLSTNPIISSPGLAHVFHSYLEFTIGLLLVYWIMNIILVGYCIYTIYIQGQYASVMNVPNLPDMLSASGHMKSHPTVVWSTYTGWL